MHIKKISIAPIDESKPDTMFHNWLLMKVVVFITIPAFFSFNIFVEQEGRNDVFFRYLLLSMILSISFFLPLACTLKNKALLSTKQPQPYYFWKFFYSFLAALISVFAYATLAPENSFGVFIYNWIWFPIIIPYCVTSAVLYSTLFAKLQFSR